MSNDDLPKFKPSEDNTEVICPHCSETFSTFLEKMAEHNLSVTCPHCGKSHPHQHSAAF